MKTKKIAVLGTGAIGSSIGADLTHAGFDVTLIDQWPAHVRAMKDNGLHVQFTLFNFDPPATDEEIRVWNIDVSPSGEGLPQGEGTVKQGAHVFAAKCAACHGPDAKGGIAFGAPDLTNNTWLYGGSRQVVEQTITHGRHGVMPAWKDILGEDKVQLLASYVYSLSHNNK